MTANRIARRNGRYVPPVTPDELMFAAGVATAAAAQKGPYLNPAELGIDIRDDDTGEVARYSPTDNPLSRGCLSVIEQFDGGEKSVALLMRITGFMRLMDDARMKPFIREACANGEPTEIRNEVLEVAATEKMSATGGFNAQRFFRKVQARVAAHDREHGAAGRVA